MLCGGSASEWVGDWEGLCVAGWGLALEPKPQHSRWCWERRWWSSLGNCDQSLLVLKIGEWFSRSLLKTGALSLKPNPTPTVNYVATGAIVTLSSWQMWRLALKSGCCCLSKFTSECRTPYSELKRVLSPNMKSMTVEKRVRQEGVPSWYQRYVRASLLGIHSDWWNAFVGSYTDHRLFLVKHP